MCKNTTEVFREGDDTTVEATTVVTSSVIAGSMALSVGNTLLTTSNSQSFWMMFNQYQLFSLLPFLNSYYSAEFKDVLNSLDFLRFKWRTRAIEAVQTGLDSALALKYRHPYQNFRENDIESGSFIINQTETLLMILLILVGDLVVIFSVWI